MKKILVTGGAGFVGSHLCARLLEQGHQVICLDNYYTGKPANIAALRRNPRFSFIEHDINQPLPPHLHIDEIYNLACPASPKHYQYDPVYTVKTSVMGILNMLELARRTGAKLLQASTSEVYGDPEVHPQTEEYVGHVNPIGPRSCYDEGKRCAETLLFDYHRQYNTRIKVIRIFNTYGPNMSMDDGRVVSNFIVQALKGENITVYGKGGQTRSFCYVDDLVDGLIKLMDSPDDITGPINVGNPTEFTILELAKHVLKLTKSKSKIIFEDLPQDDPTQRKPDITKAKKHLGWQPRVALEVGLKKTIPYFKEQIDLLARKDLVFLSNSPAPYQIDFFDELDHAIGVTGIFTTAASRGTNANWQLHKPRWLHVLPQGAWLKRFGAFCRALKGKNVQFVMIGGYKLEFSWLMLAWAKLRGVQVYFWFERPMPASPLKYALRSLVHKLILPWASGIFAIDSRAQTYYSRFNKKVVRLPYAINAARYPQRNHNQRKGPLRCLFVGQYIERKGVRELMQAFQGIKPTEAILTFAGAGPLNADIEAFCKRTGHKNLGFTQPDKLPGLFAANDVFVFPSKYDGWGVVVPEAMACGLPVISTAEVGSYADLNPHQAAGRWCTADKTSIAAAVRYYIKNTGAVATHGKAAHKAFMRSLANSKNAAEYVIARVMSVD